MREAPRDPNAIQQREGQGHAGIGYFRRRRLVDGEAVARLTATMKEIGLQHPITIRPKVRCCEICRRLVINPEAVQG